jgi:hypothetical protein
MEVPGCRSGCEHACRRVRPPRRVHLATTILLCATYLILTIFMRMGLALDVARGGSVDPDAIGAALHAGALTAEDLAAGFDPNEALRLQAVLSEREAQARLHSWAAVGNGPDLWPTTSDAAEAASCSNAPTCSCECFCRSECIWSQEVPLELVLFRSGLQQSNLQGDENLENDSASVFLLLREVMLPLLCRDEPHWRPCTRENRLANTSSFQQLRLKFGGKWGPYARCLNGQCELPDCAKAVCKESNRCEMRCPAQEVIPGRTFLSGRYSRPLGTRCRKTETRFANCERPWEVWSYMLADLMKGGLMVSLPVKGRCNSSHSNTLVHSDGTHLPTASSPCSWQLMSTGKRISVECIKGRLLKLVEGRNAACFSKCAESDPGESATECRIRCVYNTVFGNSTETKGLQERDLLEVWRLAFVNPSQGGCPGM